MFSERPTTIYLYIHLLLNGGVTYREKVRHRGEPDVPVASGCRSMPAGGVTPSTINRWPCHTAGEKYADVAGLAGTSSILRPHLPHSSMHGIAHLFANQHRRVVDSLSPTPRPGDIRSGAS